MPYMLSQLQFLHGQCIELIGSGHGSAIGAAHPPLLDHVLGPDARDDLGRCPVGLESQHGPCSPLDRPGNLLDDVDLVNRHVRLVISFPPRHRGSGPGSRGASKCA
jgi:hypothetical protein